MMPGMTLGMGATVDGVKAAELCLATYGSPWGFYNLTTSDMSSYCLLDTSDATDEILSVHTGAR